MEKKVHFKKREFIKPPKSQKLQKKNKTKSSGEKLFDKPPPTPDIRYDHHDGDFNTDNSVAVNAQDNDSSFWDEYYSDVYDKPPPTPGKNINVNNVIVGKQSDATTKTGKKNKWKKSNFSLKAFATKTKKYDKSPDGTSSKTSRKKPHRFVEKIFDKSASISNIRFKKDYDKQEKEKKKKSDKQIYKIRPPTPKIRLKENNDDHNNDDIVAGNSKDNAHSFWKEFYDNKSPPPTPGRNIDVKKTKLLFANKEEKEKKNSNNYRVSMKLAIPKKIDNRVYIKPPLKPNVRVDEDDNDYKVSMELAIPNVDETYRYDKSPSMPNIRLDKANVATASMAKYFPDAITNNKTKKPITESVTKNDGFVDYYLNRVPSHYSIVKSQSQIIITNRRTENTPKKCTVQQVTIRNVGDLKEAYDKYRERRAKIRKVEYNNDPRVTVNKVDGEKIDIPSERIPNMTIRRYGIMELKTFAPYT